MTNAIRIDESLCTRCGICSEVCPNDVIQPAEKNTFPAIQPGKEGRCISCNHCEAFCPTGALTRGSPVDTTAASPKGAASIDPDLLTSFLKNRRSIRVYRTEPVDRETIARILDIARYAASGGNGQPVEWLVMSGKAEIQKAAGLTIDWMRTQLQSSHPLAAYFPAYIANWDMGIDMICRDAPNLIFSHIPGDNPMAVTDAIIALTYVDIAAPAFGVGTCWAGLLTRALREYRPLQEMVGLPERQVVGYAMMAGYPAYQPVRIPGRKPLRVTWR